MIEMAIRYGEIIICDNCNCEEVNNGSQETKYREEYKMDLCGDCNRHIFER